ncbi:MAG: hypothetical protein NTY15_07230 [Planctomycetota bacterium]|nr:hypothetical protein [Planctomycetota bacterium]
MIDRVGIVHSILTCSHWRMNAGWSQINHGNGLGFRQMDVQRSSPVKKHRLTTTQANASFIGTAFASVEYSKPTLARYSPFQSY